jgi:5-hydroxytryptamine receptor 1
VSIHSQLSNKRESLEAKRERKAAKTLAIVTGAFVICWLPFFVIALALPTCGGEGGWCAPLVSSDVVFAVCLWLGYFNSTLNPIIYTIFSPDFRCAFKKILCGPERRPNAAIRRRS